MRKIRAFMLGMSEFRCGFTTPFTRADGGTDWDTLEAYDLGREWAHRLTLRYFDDTAKGLHGNWGERSLTGAPVWYRSREDADARRNPLPPLP